MRWAKLSNLLFSIQSISLKWKILIPFLLFAFIGTTVLVGLSFYEKRAIIEQREKEQALTLFRIFLSTINETERIAFSLANLIALDKEIGEYIVKHDKESLYELLLPRYQVLRSEHGIYQLHVHSQGAWSFLRVHSPLMPGERISYRTSVMEVQRTGISKSGLEWGLTGLSIRSVVPVWYGEDIIGSLEVGFPLDKRFLLKLKETWGVDFGLYQIKTQNELVFMASTSNKEETSILKHTHDTPEIIISPPELPHSLVLYGGLKDSEGNPIAVVEIIIDRTQIIKEIQRTRNKVIAVAIIGILVSSLLTHLVAIMIVKPIKEVVSEADQIAEGKKESLLKQRPMDEMGVLTNALNRLLSILLLRKNELERYAKLLERKVFDRTEDLIRSEEKYRTLVENLPLIVYRLLKDGTVEFVNSYFSEKLGYSIEEVVKDKQFWWRNICGSDPKEHAEILSCCWENALQMRKERKIRNKKGDELIFMDHIIPIKSNGEVHWIDGFMVDITELKALEAKLLEAEELRTLREISQRFAHEIRNPITAAGGFARRLYQGLPEDSPYKRAAEIILKEIERLESVVNILLMTIEPMEIEKEPIEIYQYTKELIEKLMEDDSYKDKYVELHGDKEGLYVEADKVLLKQALEAILCHSLHHMPSKEKMDIHLKKTDHTIMIHITHPCTGISKQDVSEFFLPRVSPYKCAAAYPLPKARIVINKHGGKVWARLFESPTEISRTEIDQQKAIKRLELVLELPLTSQYKDMQTRV
jgi:PAS domain S-box-containing protein